MPRIIAGRFRGARLEVPPGTTTRPTGDRVRESLFNQLQHRGCLAEAQILDLFAGAGTLGLEALSRGGVAARFVEQDQAALAVLRRNAARFGPAARIHAEPVERFLARSPTPCDLVFLDPPYAAGRVDATLRALLGGWLAPASLICVEHPADQAVDPPPGLRVAASRRYGITAVTLLEPEIRCVAPSTPAPSIPSPRATWTSSAGPSRSSTRWSSPSRSTSARPPPSAPTSGSR